MKASSENIAVSRLKLEGVRCNGCVSKIRKAIQAQNSNTDIDVDLEFGLAKVQGSFSTDKVIELIDELGYSAVLAPQQEYKFQVDGVNCNGCVNKIRRALETQDVNSSIEANHNFKCLNICSQVPEQELIQLLEDLGYEAGRQLSNFQQANDQQSTATELEASYHSESSVSPESLSPDDRTQDSNNPSPATTAIHLSLSGMTCAGCVKSVEDALNSVAGVHTANVNFASRNAQVLFTVEHRNVVSKQNDIDSLVSAVEQAGYGATPVEDAEQAEELREKTERQEYRLRIRNTFIGLGIGVPLMLYGLFEDMSVAGQGERFIWGFVGLITLAVLLSAGRHFFTGAWKAFLGHSANMDTLIAIGTGAAWLYSMIVVLFPGWLPAEARGLYFEAAAMIIGLINLGQALELRARGRTSQAIKRLLDLRVKTARVLRDGQEVDLAIDQVVVGDLIRIRPGEQNPVDGEVVEGHSLVDESMLTGEPIPVSKEQGSQLSAGTLNRSGTMIYRATRVGRDTALAQIIEMVRKAQNSKPPISQMADRVSAVFVPSVLITAVLTALAWFNFGPEPQIAYMLVTACTVLIIACPCALGLATPISTMIGVGKAAEYGILIRNGEALQRSSHIDVLVLDKTGTITQGAPSVTGWQTFGDVSEEEVLSVAHGVELRSEHPLAEAVVRYCQQKTELLHEGQVDSQDLNSTGDPNITQEPNGTQELNSTQELKLEAFQAHSGMGVEAYKDGEQILLGNARLMEEYHIDISEALSQASQWQQQACTVVFLSVAKKLAALIAIADPLKSDSVSAIKRLREDGLRVVMLTGDNTVTAAAVAVETNVDEYHAEMMPAGKLAFITKLQDQGHCVGMVGDGINDAPSLSQADVGFAIGSGTDVAIESADITLMRGSLNGIADAIELSRASLKNIKQNLWGAFLYNSLGIPVAAGVLYPFFEILLNPVIAGVAMSLSSLTVVSNANRLRFFSTKKVKL